MIGDSHGKSHAALPDETINTTPGDSRVADRRAFRYFCERI